MLFEIRHLSEFEYCIPVFLEPHLLRLQPRSDGAQRLHEFSLEVEPYPAGTTAMTDVYGNTVHRCWFNGTTPRLTVRSRSVVETLRENPFDFLLETQNTRLPLAYTPGELEALRPYLHDGTRGTDVNSLTEELAVAGGGSVPAFLTGLNRRIWERIDKEERPNGPPREPSETLRLGRGACRDLTVLFLAVCRRAGIAARYTSGYLHLDDEHPDPNLHAWAEVYLPGAGWRGYDPTHGLAVSDRHVAAAAAPDAAETIPVAGTFRGTGARSELRYEIAIRRL